MIVFFVGEVGRTHYRQQNHYTYEIQSAEIFEDSKY